MEMQCGDIQSFWISNDVITDHSAIEVLGADNVIISESGEVTMAEEADDAPEDQQTVAETVEVDTSMVAFVKFVQQPDGTLAPVGLVPAEEIGDQESIITDPLIVQTAEAFSRSALGHTAAAAGPSQPSSSRLRRPRAVDMSKPESCELCGSRYKNKASLKAHQRIYHSDSAAVKSRDGLRCAEAGCDFTASHLKTFSTHLVQHHNIQMNVIKLIFKDWNELTAWRSDFETETGMRYRTAQRQMSADGEMVRLHLACPGGQPPASQRRNGWRSRRPGRRGRPPGELATTRVTCTSYVRACREEAEGPVTVTVNTTHYGHTLDAASAGTGRIKEPLPESNRRFLEEALSAGWTLERIMRTARRAVLADPSPANAMFRLRRQHIYTTAHRLGVPTESLRAGADAEGDDGELPVLRALAERLTDNGEAHILLHKEAGERMEGLQDSDLVFAFTTDLQLEQLRELGAGVLMVDVTDAPRGRRYRLLSLSAFLGDGDSPRPVAWLITSAPVGRQLASALVSALTELFDNLFDDAELPAPRYFVADKHSVFHQAWAEVTGQRTMRLLDQAKVRATLSTMLVKHVMDLPQRQEVWKSVSRLMVMTGRDEQQQRDGAALDEVAARRAVYRAAAHLARRLQTQPATERFGTYLEEKWIRKGRLEEWQSAFRRGVVVPSHSAAQVFHAAVAAEYLTDSEHSLERAVTKLLEFSQRWHEPASTEKDASAPRTMAKFFPQSAALCGGAGDGPGGQQRERLRERLQALVDALREGAVPDAALPTWERAVRLMEQSVAQR